MSVDSVVSITWDALKSYVFVPIKRRFGYVISSKSFADHLQEEVRNLENETQRVRILADVARNNLRNFHDGFMEWQQSADKALEEAGGLLDEIGKASKTCCYGTLPDPKCRYQFSRMAEGKIEVIKQLARKCSGFKELNDISGSAPAPGNVTGSTLARREGKDVVLSTTVTASTPASMLTKLRDDGVFESRAAVIGAIIDALADNRNSVVGVHGMGGVGKSTLLADAEKIIKEERSFDWIAKADVSENPDIKRIQEEIADALGLSDIKNKESVSRRAELLHRRLEYEEREKKKVLIILDNLWKGLDLKSVGIPCGHDNKVLGCKLLLTSRDSYVLKSEMSCDKDFPLGELKEEEAKRLFEGLVDKVHDDDFRPLVDEALHRCAGLPFLIVNMAKYFKHASLPEWRDALNQIEGCTNEGISAKINKLLQVSYNQLESEDAKSLLKLCAACAVSEPSFENLVRYGYGMGIFQKDSSMEKARDRLSTLISTLQASSLLLDNRGADGFKIHDLVRDFVAQFILRDHPLLVLKDEEKWGTELPKDKLKRCRAICFPYANMKELPQELDCPELHIFLLLSNNESLEIPHSLFYSMRKLMVLNLNGIRLTCSPSPFQFLENLHTLCLENCSLDDVAILNKLKGLQILSFVDSNIHRLPKEIGQLVELRLLDLNYCSKLEIIEPGVLQSLIKLEELYMENSFDQWNAVEQTPPTNASLIELNRMKNLHTLRVSIPIPSVLPEDLNVKKLTKYRIRIGDVRRWSSYKGSCTLELKLDSMSNILHKGCIQSILGKTDDLFLDGLNKTEQNICTLSQRGFPKLKHLQIKNSPSTHYILQRPSHTDFKMLEWLLLDNLVNLEKMCNNKISFMSFGALKVIRVQRCHKMEVLFPLSMVRELPQLEEIRVADCKLMRWIVEVDCGKMELHNLRVLKLHSLPNVKNFFNPRSTPLISTSNRQVTTQIAFFNGQQVAFSKLETLVIMDLDNIKFLFFPSMIKSLAQLRDLQVSNCKKMEEIITEEEGLGTEISEILAFPMLTNLTLQNLESLMCFFHGKRSGETQSQDNIKSRSIVLFSREVAFSKLETLAIENLDNVEFLFSPSMIKSLAQLRDLQVFSCKKMEAIIMEEEGLGLEISETLTFPMLTSLKLNYLESLMCFSRKKCSREARSQDSIKSYCSTLFSQEVAFPKLEALDINNLDNIEMIWDNKIAADSFPKLKTLCVVDCNKLVIVVRSFILRRLLSLESLEARSCGSLEVVFELQTLNHPDGHPIPLPLKELTVSSLPKLKCIWDKELYRQIQFQCLRSISVSRCESLTSLFPTSVARDLIQLEELEIDECAIVEIIENEEGLVPRFVFPMLTSLKLKYLGELKCLYIGSHTSHWPALKTLKVHHCDKVEILASHSKNEMPPDKLPLFSIEKGAFPNLQKLELDLSKQMEIWHGHFHDGEFFCKLSLLKLCHLSQESSISTCRFVESLTNLEELVVCESYLEDPSNNEEAIEGTSHEMKVILPFSRYIRHLQTLDVSHCDGLSKMFTPTIAKNLVALKKLKISNCRILVEVINDEKGGEGHVVAFNQLKYMELDGLTRLRSFSSGRYTLMFPLLEDAIVTRCPSMKFFSQGPIEASKLKRVQVSKEAWFWAGNLNITIQNMFEELVTLAGVKKMLLSEFPGLIGKWHNELNPIKSYWELKSMVVDKCSSFVNAIPSRLMLVLDNLSFLQVRDCKLLEEIFDLEGLEAMESTRVLPKLQELNLANLPKLRQLWNKDLQESIHFNSLGTLILYNCSNLGHAFAPSMARCLANLEWMEIKGCGQMEEVIVEEEGHGSAMEKITFPKLWQIKLECLPNLTCFLSRKNHTLECPKLVMLSITHCPKMRSLTEQSWMENDHDTPSLFTSQVQFPQLMRMDLSHMDYLSKIWTDGPLETLTFDCLWEVKVLNCKSLENLFPYWVATSLTKLGKLQVESCEIEEIVASGDDTPRSNTTQDLFPKLTSLVLHDMPRLKSFCPNLPLNLPLLKELRVTHCEKLSMLSFVASMNRWAQRDDQQDLSDQEAHSSFERDFPNLERLLLVNNNIQMIQDGNFSDDMFSKLKALTLACFHDKKAVFPSIFLLERFQNLQSLEVFCSSLEDLFPNEGLVEERKHLVLENLRELKLNKLHNLECVWREDSLVSKILQSIKTFEVWDCPSLTTIFPTETSFQNLIELVVKNSSGLVHLVTTSAVTNLVHLTSMTIIGCERMKEVVADDGNREGKVISFEKLKRLTLEHLPNLECFSSIPSCIFRFPSLWCIKVEECPKMKTFSKGTLSTPKLNFVALFKYKWGGNWEKDDDLNTIIQKLAA